MTAPQGLLDLLEDGRAESDERGLLDAAGPQAEPAGFPLERLERIREMERWHFWFAGRRARLDRLLRAYLATPRLVLDVGCGTGLTLEQLAGPHRVVGTDLRDEGLRALRERDEGAWVVRADATALPFRDGVFDLVLLLDVLEHVPDAAALAEARRVARPGGLVAVSVPALPRLWSGRDRAAGHLRRYTRRGLERLLRDGGLAVEALGYYQFFLLPLVVLSRLSNRSSDRPVELEERPPRALNRVFTAINRAEAALADIVPPPLGSSLIAVARRPA